MKTPFRTLLCLALALLIALPALALGETDLETLVIRMQNEHLALHGSDTLSAQGVPLGSFSTEALPAGRYTVCAECPIKANLVPPPVPQLSEMTALFDEVLDGLLFATRMASMHGGYDAMDLALDDLAPTPYYALSRLTAEADEAGAGLTLLPVVFTDAAGDSIDSQVYMLACQWNQDGGNAWLCADDALTYAMLSASIPAGDTAEADNAYLLSWMAAYEAANGITPTATPTRAELPYGFAYDMTAVEIQDHMHDTFGAAAINPSAPTWTLPGTGAYWEGYTTTVNATPIRDVLALLTVHIGQDGGFGLIDTAVDSREAGVQIIAQDITPIYEKMLSFAEVQYGPMTYGYLYTEDFTTGDAFVYDLPLAADGTLDLATFHAALLAADRAGLVCGFGNVSATLEANLYATDGAEDMAADGAYLLSAEAAFDYRYDLPAPMSAPFAGEDGPYLADAAPTPSADSIWDLATALLLADEPQHSTTTIAMPSLTGDPPALYLDKQPPKESAIRCLSMTASQSYMLGFMDGPLETAEWMIGEFIARMQEAGKKAVNADLIAGFDHVRLLPSWSATRTLDGATQLLVPFLLADAQGESTDGHLYLFFGTWMPGSTVIWICAEDASTGELLALMDPGTGGDAEENALLRPLAEAAQEQAETPSATQSVRVISDSAVNIRAASGTDSAILAKAQPGEIYPTNGLHAGGWYEIVLPDGRIGFISPKMVEVVR